MLSLLPPRLPPLRVLPMDPGLRRDDVVLLFCYPWLRLLRTRRFFSLFYSYFATANLTTVTSTPMKITTPIKPAMMT